MGGQTARVGFRTNPAFKVETVEPRLGGGQGLLKLFTGSRHPTTVARLLSPAGQHDNVLARVLAPSRVEGHRMATTSPPFGHSVGATPVAGAMLQFDTYRLPFQAAKPEG
jgi:hypothetical protein